MENLFTSLAIFLGMVVIISLIIGLPVMMLWNTVMPDIFGLTTISFWQAVGLTMLCGFLFGTSNTSK